MALLLTSFQHARHYAEHGWVPHSIARWQPKNTSHPELPFLAAADRAGRPLKLRNFPDPRINGYSFAYGNALFARWPDIAAWLKNLRVEDKIALCCWCPYSIVAERQLRAHGTFFCHSLLIRELIRTARPDILVYLDEDREQRAIGPTVRWWGDNLDGAIRGLQPTLVVREEDYATDATAV